MKKTVIELRHVNKSYFLEEKEFSIIRDVNVIIKEGEFVAIVGPSGSGKSTMMNIIGLLDRPTSGEYFLDEKNMENVPDATQADIRGKKIGFVFQNYSLIPRLSVLEQVMLPLSYHGVARSEAKIRAEKSLSRVGLSEHFSKKPEQLSGGQKQRVAIARAMVTNPRLILADEPTGALDTKTGREVMELFRDLNAMGVTVLIITHSDEIAESVDRVIRIRDGIVTG